MSRGVGVVVVVIVMFEVRMKTLLQQDVFIAESTGGDGERPRRRRALRKGLSEDRVVQGGFCGQCIAVGGGGGSAAAAAAAAVASG